MLRVEWAHDDDRVERALVDEVADGAKLDDLVQLVQLWLDRRVLLHLLRVQLVLRLKLRVG